MADYTVDSEPLLCGGGAPADITTGAGMQTRRGDVGGAVLSEIRQRLNGAGTSVTTIPEGFYWKLASGGVIGTIDNDAVYVVDVTDNSSGGTWATVASIAAEITP